MITKHLGTFGPDQAAGDVHEIRCLNRLIRWVSPPFGGIAYLDWEPDPRHAELLIDAMGLMGSSKSLSAPGVKRPKGVDET
eukprot:10436335-Heterocapsa_arctica.AAC.1